MTDKQALLDAIRKGLRSGIISINDIQTLIAGAPTVPASDSETNAKLSSIDIIFYVAGIIFYATILSLIAQTWGSGNALLHIALSGFVGLVLWAIAYTLLKGSVQNDIRKGLTNTLLLTGSLLLIAGGYIITNELLHGYDTLNFMPMALTLVILGALHISFDRYIKRKLILLMGVLLGVAAFPSFMFGILDDAHAPLEAWMMVMIAASGLLAGATRVVAKISRDRATISSSFDSFAAFVALMSMYVASFGGYSGLWLCILIAATLGLFYISILSQNKHMLGSGSFFIVLAIITISFKYFSGYGVTFSLVIATLGLLGTAVAASTINKKYFK